MNGFIMSIEERGAEEIALPYRTRWAKRLPRGCEGLAVKFGRLINEVRSFVTMRAGWPSEPVEIVITTSIGFSIERAKLAAGAAAPSDVFSRSVAAARAFAELRAFRDCVAFVEVDGHDRPVILVNAANAQWVDERELSATLAYVLALAVRIDGRRDYSGAVEYAIASPYVRDLVMALVEADWAIAEHIEDEWRQHWALSVYERAGNLRRALEAVAPRGDGAFGSGTDEREACALGVGDVALFEDDR